MEVDRAGFEPAASALRTAKTGLNQGVFDRKSVNWEDFRSYLNRKPYRGTYGNQMFNAAFLYADCLFESNLSALSDLSPSRKIDAIKGLSHLTKFLGCNDEFKLLLKKYGLTWMGRSVDDLIIDRLNARNDPEEVFQWIRDFKEARPDYSVFMDFDAVTGLRLSEAVNSYNLIIKLTAEGTLSKNYYNVKTGFLEHFHFKELFIRKSKKAFVSYVPLELLDAIGKLTPLKRLHTARKVLVRRHIPQRFGDVRENHASFVTQWLRPEEIDFLHGRVTASIFMQHYYNPLLVSDLRSRCSQAAQAILLKVNSELLLKKDAGGEKID